MAAITISGDLISHTRSIYQRELASFDAKTTKLIGLNFFISDAYPAYICSVAAVEAYINESLLGIQAQSHWRDSLLWQQSTSWRDNLGLLNKLALFPALLVGRSFQKDQEPFQRMRLLVKVRNNLTHYKFDTKPPRYLVDLEAKGIIIPAPSERGDYPWASKLQCAEGVRWAHNTACDTVHGLVDILGDGNDHLTYHGQSQNFQHIEDSYVRQVLESKGVSFDE